MKTINEHTFSPDNFDITKLDFNKMIILKETNLKSGFFCPILEVFGQCMYSFDIIFKDIDLSNYTIYDTSDLTRHKNHKSFYMIGQPISIENKCEQFYTELEKKYKVSENLKKLGYSNEARIGGIIVMMEFAGYDLPKKVINSFKQRKLIPQKYINLNVLSIK